MPYKLSDDKKAVMEQKDGEWHVKKRYTGTTAETKARAYLAALIINVDEAKKGK